MSRVAVTDGNNDVWLGSRICQYCGEPIVSKNNRNVRKYCNRLCSNKDKKNIDVNVIHFHKSRFASIKLDGEVFTLPMPEGMKNKLVGTNRSKYVRNALKDMGINSVRDIEKSLSSKMWMNSRELVRFAINRKIRKDEGLD